MPYTITLKPAGKGQVTATSTDGQTLLTTTPLCDFARYWLTKGADPADPIVTLWSSGTGDWSLRSTISTAAKLTVMGAHFHHYKPPEPPITAPPAA